MRDYLVTHAVFVFLAVATASGQSIGTTESAVVGENGRVAVSVRRAIELSEEKAFLSDIGDIAVVDENSFYVASSDVARLVAYDGHGRQTAVVGQWGEGPFEYARPSRIRIAQDSLVVWDSSNLKYIVFDLHGVPRREIPGSFAISDFDWTEEFIVTYRSGRPDDFITIVDRRSQTDSAVGVGSHTHLALMLLDGSGRLGIGRDHVYYASPARPVLVAYDLKSKRERVVGIDNADFDLNERRYKDRADIQRDFSNGGIVDFLMQNSRVRGVWVLNDLIIAVVENGRYGENVRERDRRRLDLEVFDFQLRPIDSIGISADHIERWGHLLPGSFRNRLYFVKEPGVTLTGAESPRTLFELELAVEG